MTRESIKERTFVHILFNNNTLTFISKFVPNKLET